MIFDVPRITSAQRDAIASPEISEVIYNTDEEYYEYWDGITWVILGPGLGNYTNEATGFPVGSNGEVDRTSSTISFDAGSRTFSIAPASTSFSILIKNRVYVKTTTLTRVIPDTEGMHYIYFDENANLTSTTTFSTDIILKYVYVASIYWNAADNEVVHFGDERHGCVMDGATHIRIHTKDGAIFVSGGALNNFSVDGDGSSATHAQFSIGAAQIRDEDIPHSLSAVNATTAIPVLYKSSGNWRKHTTTNFKVYPDPTTGRLYYNSNGGSLAAVGNNKFVLYHVVATNDVLTPFVSIMGSAQYDNKSDARTGAVTEIKNLTGLPFVEFVFMGSIIFQTNDAYTNSVKAKIVSTDTGTNYVDWRFASSGLNPTTVQISSHNNLGGIQGGSAGNFYHSNQEINTTSSPTFAGLTLTSNAIIGGDLTVNGTTTTINSTTLAVDDKNIILGDVGSPSDVTADGGGITLKGATDKTLNWVDATDSWTSSEHIDIAIGKVFKINGTTVLSATQVLGKTLPSGDVVGTSDSQTLTNKTINGNDNTITNIPVKQITNGLATTDLANTTATVDLSSYTTTGIRLQNPAQITFSNGTAGTWYTIVIESDGIYNFTSEVRFPLDNAQPNVSADGKVDIYSLYCVSATKYLATFAFQYTSVF